LFVWRPRVAYYPLIFVDSLPRARFCNSLVALKIESNKVQHALATTLNIPQVECNVAGGLHTSLGVDTDKGHS
jgi:hypothetical protein